VKGMELKNLPRRYYSHRRRAGFGLARFAWKCLATLAGLCSVALGGAWLSFAILGIEQEANAMSASYRVVAVNGSPHQSFGNTSLMLAMLKEGFEAEGVGLEEIFLNQHHIEYCAGCGFCLEKGGCWIRDDHKSILARVLAADAIILASPVYFYNVTGQTKTFLDRSLSYGHRPRGTWKPGLAVSVSAGQGETTVAQYLGRMLAAFGAFPVGHLTAIAIGPGEFLGRQAVEARAAHLAQDLFRALKEGWRYPATDQDLAFWLFMGHLVKENQGFMKADHAHWEKLGLYESFEAYVGQTRSQGGLDSEARQAWLQELMARQKETPKVTPVEAVTPVTRWSVTTMRELLEGMPQDLDPNAAAGLTATYQFEVHGSENFTAHLCIENQRASFHEGAAENPDVIIKTTPEVWLAISRGEQSGAWAYFTGKYTVEGDLNLVKKLDSLFPR